MDVAISGSSGLVGSALSESLVTQGHRPVALVRRNAKPGADEIGWDPASGVLDSASLEGIDAVVHLAGAGIGDKRWSDSRKDLLRQSRTRSTALLAETVANLTSKPQVFVSGSAIGFYGSQGDQVLDEGHAVGSGFLAELCRDWEAAATPASQAGIRTALIRTSLVLSGSGGALGKQLPLFKHGLGGRFGPGTQWMSWISLRDEVRAIEFLLANDVSGPVNLCAPNPVTNIEFTKTLGSILKRPTMLPVPLFGPKLLFGAELVEELILASQRVTPSVLTGAGFSFEDPTLEPALRHVLKR